MSDKIARKKMFTTKRIIYIYTAFKASRLRLCQRAACNLVRNFYDLPNDFYHTLSGRGATFRRMNKEKQ